MVNERRPAPVRVLRQEREAMIELGRLTDVVIEAMMFQASMDQWVQATTAPQRRSGDWLEEPNAEEAQAISEAQMALDMHRSGLEAAILQAAMTKDGSPSWRKEGD